MGGHFFLRAISLGWVVVPSLKIVINLPRTYEKLLPVNENHMRDPSAHTHRQIILLYFKDLYSKTYFISRVLVGTTGLPSVPQLSVPSRPSGKWRRKTKRNKKLILRIGVDFFLRLLYRNV